MFFIGFAIILVGAWQAVQAVLPVLVTPVKPTPVPVLVSEGVTDFLTVFWDLPLPEGSGTVGNPPNSGPYALPRQAVLPQLELEEAGLIKPKRLPGVPDRIVIPAIELDAPVVRAKSYRIDMDGQLFGLFMAPSRFAAGWHPTSARLGEIGNTVINGHHNMLGRVFQNLVNVSVGDEIIMYSRDREYRYIVTQKMILMERDAPVTVRANNARWMMRSTDERLTLITCWPAYSNTHRLVIVAAPVDAAP